MDDPRPVDRQRWVCRICGYIYDPALHDGMIFEDVPDDWRCPGCGFGKAVFARLGAGVNEKKGLS